MEHPPKFMALVRDGAAFDFARFDAIGTDKKGAPIYPVPLLDGGVTTVEIVRGFDPLSERVDLLTGEILPDLAMLESALHGRIDAEYEARVDVPGPVKSAEYAAKLAEARAVVAGGDPGPMLMAEAGEDGDVQQLAQAIIARADEAAAALADLAAARRTAKANVTAATSAAAMRAAADAYIVTLIAPTPGAAE